MYGFRTGRRPWTLVASLLLCVMLSLVLHSHATASRATGRPTSSLARLDATSHAPLSFEANRGQTASRVRFLTRGNGYTLFFTPSAMVLNLAGKPAAKTM